MRERPADPLQRAPGEPDRLLETALIRREYAGPTKHHGIPGRELQCSPKRNLGTSPIPLVHHLDPPDRRMTFRQIRF